MTSYFAAPAERRDVLRPETDNPLTVSALGTAITGSGFSNPYLVGGGINPLPADHRGRLRLVQPGADALHARPGRRARPADGDQGLPACRPPARSAARTASASRRPVNHSYGLQLALAWDQPASISTRIPAASGDVTAFKALSLGAAVNFFDPRNPVRTPDAIWNPGLTTQDFTDRRSPTRPARWEPSRPRSPRYGTALHQTTGVDDQPDAHRAQPDPRAAVGLRRPGRRPLERCASSSSSSAAPACRRPARSSSPTCASRRRPPARRSTPTSSPTSR